MKPLSLLLFCATALFCACGTGNSRSHDSGVSPESQAAAVRPAAFDADSAYAYVKRQVDFGPRVPNTAAHAATGEWLASELRRHGADVRLQQATLTAFDGTPLKAVNIVGSFNPKSPRRVLLTAHWDSRPWADQDPDEKNRRLPVPGANDGASGVGVLLEIARQLGLEAPGIGVDILFVDAEDWGDEGRDDSWALGARYFVENWPEGLPRPQAGVLLDMVGGRDARFRREQFSSYYAPELCNQFWGVASDLGYGDIFSNETGGAITDDHLQFIRAGIPVIDVIEFHPGTGFNPNWHTLSDDMDGIDAATLGAVGTTTLTWLRSLKPD